MAETTDLMTVFFIITMEQPTATGVRHNTTWRELQVPVGTSQMELFHFVQDRFVPEDMRGGPVIFYSAVPATIGDTDKVSQIP